MHTYICTCSVQYMAFVQLQGINKIKQLQIQIIIKLKQLNAIYFKISIIKTLFYTSWHKYILREFLLFFIRAMWTGETCFCFKCEVFLTVKKHCLFLEEKLVRHQRVNGCHNDSKLKRGLNTFLICKALWFCSAHPLMQIS